MGAESPKSWTEGTGKKLASMRRRHHGRGEPSVEIAAFCSLRKLQWGEGTEGAE